MFVQTKLSFFALTLTGTHFYTHEVKDGKWKTAVDQSSAFLTLN